MKPRKRTIKRCIIVVTFTVLMLCVFPTITIYDGNQVEPKGSVNLLEEDITKIEPEPVSSPKGDAIPAEATWGWAAADTLSSAPWGSADYPSRLTFDDGTICRMSEEWDGANYRFDIRFRTALVPVTRYLTHQLRMDFTQVWSLAPEDLRFYVALGTASGTEGTYHYIGQLSGPGLYTFDLERSILFNRDITSSRYVYVKVLGAIESSDWGNGNVWDFDFLGIASCNYAPRLLTATVDKIEDDTIYAGLGVSGNNYATITIEAECLDGSDAWYNIGLRYEQGSDYWEAGWTWWTMPYGLPDTTFSQSSDWVEYISGTFSFTSTTIIVSWKIKFNWNHPSELGMDLTLSTFATSPFSPPEDPTIEELPWRIESRLTMQSAPSIEESRVRTGETCSFTGDIEYHGSSGHWSPLASEVDIQVRRNSPQASSWIYSAEPASDGTFTVNPSTVSTSGTNTFELQVVADGTTTNLLTSTYFDTVIGDRVVVSSNSIGSTNHNIAYAGGVCNTGQTGLLFLELEWESSGSSITSATSVSWASTEDVISLSYSSERWGGQTYARSTVGEQAYNDLTVILDGIDFEIVNEPSYSVLWDEIVILSTVIAGGDDYVNIGNSVTILVTAQLSYMGHILDPGIDMLYMNGVRMNDGGSYFTHIISHSYPSQWMFSVDSSDALENTFGITKIALGKPNVSCIWDTFLVDLYLDDSHVSIDDTVKVWAHVTRAYDGSTFSGSMGSVVLRHTISSDIVMTYSSLDGMWYADVTQGTANKWSFFIHSIFDTAEGISTVGRGLYFDGIDDYIDCGSNPSLDLTATLTLSTWFYGDGIDWGSGMYLLAKKDNNNAQYSLYIHSDRTLRFIYFNGTIREIILKSAITTKTWHNVIVTVSGTHLNCWYDGIHVLENVILPAKLVSFPSAPLLIGAQKSVSSTSYHFKGFISEVRIYDFVLTKTQCMELYLGQDPDGYNLNLFLGRASVDISTGIWNDQSGANNDGTIIGPKVTIGTLPMNNEEVVSIIWDGAIITITDPFMQTLSLGQNASGIIVTGIYAYDGLPYDGHFQLNNTLFSYSTPGCRGYTVESIFGDSRGITSIVLNDATYACWVLEMTILHLQCSETSIPVSTIYDSQFFSIDVYLTDTALHKLSGWINLSINGTYYPLFCDGVVNSVFTFTPEVSGIYLLEALFEGDSNYSSSENSISLTAELREIDFIDGFPDQLTAGSPTSVSFLNVYDTGFQGQFQDITYIHNLPINASFSIWWTISSDFGYPRTHCGTWNITSGAGIGEISVPWDLDGNGYLSSTDFMCYFIIYLDGDNIYESYTIETPVAIQHPLEVNIQIPSLVYSDQSTIGVQVNPLYDSYYPEGLQIPVTLFVSDDNSSWVKIGELITDSFGWRSMNWTCNHPSRVFFKVETSVTEFYACSCGYEDVEVGKEDTVLAIEYVGNFTYSDQGMLVASLLTDDGEPIPDYSVFLEILDGTWISIGSGLTNASGHVSILWVPILPSDTYAIRIRASLSDSEFYLSPEISMGLLEVDKELTVVSIDPSTFSQGYILARVLDDDGNPVPNVIVNFYTGSEREFRGTRNTDTDGYSRLDISLTDGEILEAVVNENNYYLESNHQVTVSVPPDFMSIGIGVGAFFALIVGIAVSRKVIHTRRLSPLDTPRLVSPEISKALERERDSIPERVREHSEKQLAELDGMVIDSRESSETLPIDDGST